MCGHVSTDERACKDNISSSNIIDKVSIKFSHGFTKEITFCVEQGLTHIFHRIVDPDYLNGFAVQRSHRHKAIVHRKRRVTGQYR